MPRGVRRPPTTLPTRFARRNMGSLRVPPRPNLRLAGPTERQRARHWRASRCVQGPGPDARPALTSPRWAPRRQRSRRRHRRRVPVYAVTVTTCATIPPACGRGCLFSPPAQQIRLYCAGPGQAYIWPKSKFDSFQTGELTIHGFAWSLNYVMQDLTKLQHA